MRLFQALLSVSLFLAFVSGDSVNLRRIHERIEIQQRSYLKKQDSALLEENVDTHFFRHQRIDHFDSANDATFSQRYYVNSNYYNEGNPIFLYVGGEAELRPTAVSAGSLAALAMKHNALVLGLEHRFYGVSHPFPERMTAENLQFLSSSQALQDLAFFIEEYPSLDPRVSADSKWVIVGGSYPGNLAAWFRLKFPHLVVGAWASSAPVTARSDFWMYDAVVGKQLGDECANYVRGVTQELEILFEDQEALDIAKSKFHPSMSVDVKNNVAFMYILADIVAYAVQYDNPSVGLRDKLCSVSSEGSLDTFAEFVRFFFSYSGSTPAEMDMTSYTSESTSDPSQNMRQWMWQSCAEFGYWQSAPLPSTGIKSLRSKYITTAWHEETICQGIFKFSPDHRAPVNDTNTIYGATKIARASSRIIFTNGSRDPWKTLGIEGKSVATSDTSKATCSSWLIKESAHCGDLHAASTSDPDDLTKARALIVKEISHWLKE